jgi:hypothetical protein
LTFLVHWKGDVFGPYYELNTLLFQCTKKVKFAYNSGRREYIILKNPLTKVSQSKKCGLKWYTTFFGFLIDIVAMTLKNVSNHEDIYVVKQQSSYEQVKCRKQILISNIFSFNF